MWPVVTNEVVYSVCRSVTIVNLAQTAELIEISFGIWTRVGPRIHVLDGVHIGATYLANTIEPSMCVHDAALG